jgi:hypothetical protein
MSDDLESLINAEILRNAELYGELSTYLGPAAISQARGEVAQRFTDPVDIQRQNEKLDSAAQTKARLSASRNQIVRSTAGKPEVATQAWEAAKAGAAKGVEVAGSAIGGALHVLDTPARAVRTEVSGKEDSQEFASWVREQYPDLAGLADIIGSPIQAVGNVVGSTLGAAGDLLAGEDLATVAGRFGENVTSGGRQAGDLLINMAADPLTYFSFGAGSAGKTAARQASKAAQMLGMDGRAAAAAAGTMARMANKPGFIEAMVSETGLPLEALERFMGPGLRYAGKSGLEVSLPFSDFALEFLSREQIRPITGPVWNVLTKLHNKAGGNSWELPVEFGGLHASEAAKDFMARQRNLVPIRSADEMARLRDNIEDMPEWLFEEKWSQRVRENPEAIWQNREREAYRQAFKQEFSGIDAKRMTRIHEDIIDPGYHPPRELPPEAAMDPNVIAWHLSRDTLKPVAPGDPSGAWFEIVPNPKPNAIKLEELNAQEAGYVQLVQDYLDQQRNRLVAADLMDEFQGAYNPISGLYIPRMFKGEKYNPLGIPQGQPRYSVGKARGAAGGRAVGNAGKDQVWMNPMSTKEYRELEELNGNLASTVRKIVEAKKDAAREVRVLEKWLKDPEKVKLAYGQEVHDALTRALDITKDFDTVQPNLRPMLEAQVKDLSAKAMKILQQRDKMIIGAELDLTQMDVVKVMGKISRTRVKDQGHAGLMANVEEVLQQVSNSQGQLTGEELGMLQDELFANLANMPQALRKKIGLGAGLPTGYRNARRTMGLSHRLDMDEIITRYQPQVENAIANVEMKRWIADHMADQPGSVMHHGRMTALKNTRGEQVQVPTEIYNGLMDQYQGQFKSFHQTVFDKVTNLFKQQALLGVPRFHTINMLGDSFMMWANGVRNPLRFEQARTLWNGKKGVVLRVNGRSYTGDELRQFLSERGIGRFGDAVNEPQLRTPGYTLEASRAVAGGAGKTGALAKAAGSAALRDGDVASALAGQAMVDVGSMGLARLGKKVASWWDETAKTAFFIDRLSKGESPEQAIRSTFQVLFDYGDQDQMLRVLKKAMPFATWQYKSLASIPRTVARSPYAAVFPKRVAEAFGAQPGDYEDPAPQYMQERGQLFRFNPSQRATIAKWYNGLQTARQSTLQAMGFEGGQVVPLDPGYGLVAPSRDPITEGAAPVANILNGNYDPILQMLHPVIRIVAEALTQKDLFTKRDMERPDLARPFSFGDPMALQLEKAVGLTPGSLQAHEGQMAWFSRNVPQFLVSPLVSHIANEAARSAGAPGVVYGAYRPYSADPELRNAASLTGQLTGLQVGQTGPAGVFEQVQYGQEMKELESTRRSMKADESRKARQRGPL